MTTKLSEEDSHLREFSARVLDCRKEGDGWAVILDRTAFFPEGGGQEGDRGELENVRVLDTRIRDGEIHPGMKLQSFFMMVISTW